MVGHEMLELSEMNKTYLKQRRTICKYNKTGYCRNKDQCFNLHIAELCTKMFYVLIKNAPKDTQIVVKTLPRGTVSLKTIVHMNIQLQKVLK